MFRHVCGSSLEAFRHDTVSLPPRHPSSVPQLPVDKAYDLEVPILSPKKTAFSFPGQSSASFPCQISQGCWTHDTAGIAEQCGNMGNMGMPLGAGVDHTPPITPSFWVCGRYGEATLKKNSESKGRVLLLDSSWVGEMAEYSFASIFSI